jgi:hypothetical protein
MPDGEADDNRHGLDDYPQNAADNEADCAKDAFKFIVHGGGNLPR